MPRGQRSLASSTPDNITVYGRDLCADILGLVDFAGMLFLGLLDRVPDAAESRALNSLLVSLVEHGATPSTIAARMTYFGAPESLRGAIPAALLGLGSVFVGSIEGAAQMRQEDLAGDTSELADEERAAKIVSPLRLTHVRFRDLATRCTSQSIRAGSAAPRDRRRRAGCRVALPPDEGGAPGR
jgi:hypothetical protein